MKWEHTHDPEVWERHAEAWDKLDNCEKFAENSRSQAQRLRDGHACRLCEFLGKCEKCTK